MKQPVFNVMLLKVLAMAIREGVDSDEDKGACWGQVARLLATPKEASWVAVPSSYHNNFPPGHEV